MKSRSFAATTPPSHFKAERIDTRRFCDICVLLCEYRAFHALVGKLRLYGAGGVRGEFVDKFTFHVYILSLTSGSGVSRKMAAKLVTTVQDWISIFIQDIFAARPPKEIDPID